MRRPGFEPGLPDWQSDVLDQTGRPSHPITSHEKNIAYFNSFINQYAKYFRIIFKSGIKIHNRNHS